MRNRTIALIKSLLYLVLLCIGLGLLRTVMLPKTLNQNKWIDYYKLPNQTVDMLFLGSSHSFRSFVPMIFNEELGLDAYCLATSGATIEQEYFVLKEALKSQSPKVVVLEMFSIRPYYTSIYSVQTVHKAFDTMNLSQNKINAVNYNVTDNKRLEFILPLTVYHNRWREIEMGEDIVNPFNNTFDPSPYYGYVAQTKSGFTGEITDVTDPALLTSEMTFLPEDRMRLLDAMTQLCHENNIKLFYVAAPFTSQSDVTYVDLYESLHGLETYAKQNDIDIINFNQLIDETALETIDFANNGHLNVSGATKVSNYLAEYILTNYPDLLEGVEYDFELKSKEKYQSFLKELADFNEKIDGAPGSDKELVVIGINGCINLQSSISANIEA